MKMQSRQCTLLKQLNLLPNTFTTAKHVGPPPQIIYQILHEISQIIFLVF